MRVTVTHHSFANVCNFHKARFPIFGSDIGSDIGMPFSPQKIVHQTEFVFATRDFHKNYQPAAFQKSIQTCIFLSITIILPQSLITVVHDCLNVALRYIWLLVSQHMSACAVAHLFPRDFLITFPLRYLRYRHVLLSCSPVPINQQSKHTCII